jgi:nitroreductase
MLSNPVIDNIFARRSIRSYSNEPVNDTIIKDLIKAGFQAANGMNLQKLRFVVVTNSEQLREYSDIGKKEYLKIMKDQGFSNPGLEANLNNEQYSIFYDAPAAIFIYAAPGILTGVEDASLAAGNIMLAARSLGIGTCWIGLAAGLGNNRNFMKECKVPNDHKLLASIILGYPKSEFPEPSKRADAQVLGWVR